MSIDYNYSMEKVADKKCDFTRCRQNAIYTINQNFGKSMHVCKKHLKEHAKDNIESWIETILDFQESES